MLFRILPLLLLTLAACSPGAAPKEMPASEAAYIGDVACASCHEDQYASFQGHGMANSFYPMSADRVVEDFGAGGVYHPETDFWYRAFREGDGFFQEEFRLNGREKSHSLIREITHVVGSAKAARTYLTEINDRYYELPLTWYAQKGIWDLSPGYREANSRFDRKMTAPCAACHTDGPPVTPGLEDAFARTPLAVSCERCHGPGSEHAAARRAVPEPAGDADPTIVNPAHLDLDARLDVCQQCHLGGEVFVYPAGRGAYSFRPGEPLREHRIMFASAHEGGLNVISHADRMKQSACFLETQGTPAPMDCTTCHDPHQGYRDAGSSYFTATCMRCHPGVADRVPEYVRQDHQAAANCIACHMARREAEDAPHSSFTDHFIRTTVPSEQEIAPPDEIILQPASGPASTAELAQAYISYGWARADRPMMARGIGLAEESRTEYLRNPGAAVLLGRALLATGEAGRAVPVLRAALQGDSVNVEGLHGMARAFQDTGDPVEAARHFRRALRHSPRSAAILTDFGKFEQAQGNLSAAEALYRRAIDQEPWLTDAHNGLAAVLLEDRRPVEAAEAAQEVLRLNPDHVEGMTNLGTALARTGQVQEAVRILERAVVLGRAAGNAVPAFNLGVVSLQQRDFRRAMEYLALAQQLNPSNMDAGVMMAYAHMGLGNRRAALDQLDRVLQAVPGHPAAMNLRAQIQSGN